MSDAVCADVAMPFNTRKHLSAQIPEGNQHHYHASLSDCLLLLSSNVDSQHPCTHTLVLTHCKVRRAVQSETMRWIFIYHPQSH